MSCKKKCKECGRDKPYKKRYVVQAGEMGTQEVVDLKTGDAFYGSDADVINQLIKELNRLDREKE
jgi:hypothetical protein